MFRILVIAALFALALPTLVMAQAPDPHRRPAARPAARPGPPRPPPGRPAFVPHGPPGRGPAGVGPRGPIPRPPRPLARARWPGHCPGGFGIPGPGVTPGHLQS